MKPKSSSRPHPPRNLLPLCSPNRSPPADIDKRVDSLLQQMTLEEKIDYIGGIDDFYIRAIPRLGIPALRMSDGPIGVHDYGLTTAYSAGIALAASWDADLAHRVGVCDGKRCTRPWCSLHPRSRPEHLPRSHGRTQLRVLRRGSFSVVAHGSGRDRRHSEPAGPRHRQALRGQQSGVRTQQAQL